jgi:hypothetical protein
MSKFEFKDNRPFSVKVKSFMQSLLFWKGRKKGVIHTIDVEWTDIRAVFFPKDAHEKYRYLGSVPWNLNGDIFKAMEPLIVFMDSKAKPWWCPRWFLRFLNLFGNDNSIVRVRNQFLHNLHNKITKGYRIYDYKTKWTDYDLRISIGGNEQMWWLTEAIERYFYQKGYKAELIELIGKIDPKRAEVVTGWTTDMLQEELEKLENNRKK